MPAGRDSARCRRRGSNRPPPTGVAAPPPLALDNVVFGVRTRSAARTGSARLPRLRGEIELRIDRHQLVGGSTRGHGRIDGLSCRSGTTARQDRRAATDCTGTGRFSCPRGRRPYTCAHPPGRRRPSDGTALILAMQASIDGNVPHVPILASDDDAGRPSAGRPSSDRCDPKYGVGERGVLRPSSTSVVLSTRNTDRCRIRVHDRRSFLVEARRSPAMNARVTRS